MAHYAFLDKNNIVTEVITGIDETETIEGLTPEEWYGKFRGQKCVRTSYNHNIRAHFAGVGFKYYTHFYVFIPPRPYKSWKMNYTTFDWEAPTAKPTEIEGYIWLWSEDNTEWIKLQRPYK
jgi:hypothetical protein